MRDSSNYKESLSYKQVEVTRNDGSGLFVDSGSNIVSGFLFIVFILTMILVGYVFFDRD